MKETAAFQASDMISVQNVVKEYGKKRAVNDISFSVKAGEVFAFLGPNGAGKTTTIKMLTTLLPPDKGVIKIDGMDVARQAYEVRRRFGVVFQDCTLDQTATVYENLWMHCSFYQIPRSERKRRIAEVLELFNITSHQRVIVEKLSGGLKRRVELARALLHQPVLIFLDEPTLGLDPQSRRLLWDHLHFLKKTQNLTVFLTTHYLDEVERFADTVAVINQGKIIAAGSVSDVISHAKGQTLEDAFLSLTGQLSECESVFFAGKTEIEDALPEADN